MFFLFYTNLDSPSEKLLRLADLPTIRTNFIIYAFNHSIISLFFYVRIILLSVSFTIFKNTLTRWKKHFYILFGNFNNSRAEILKQTQGKK